MRTLLKQPKTRLTARNLSRVFLCCDLHGSEVSVNLEGETRYRTLLGSLLSIATLTSVIYYVALRLHTLAQVRPKKALGLPQMLNLVDHGYENLRENNMDVMFGFFDTNSDDGVKRPVALPKEYGSFSLYLSGQPLAAIEDCSASKHFTTVEVNEAQANFFPSASLLCLNT